jgi:hypothetical protein
VGVVTRSYGLAGGNVDGKTLKESLHLYNTNIGDYLGPDLYLDLNLLPSPT